MPAKKPPHSGDFIPTEIVEPAGLSMTAFEVKAPNAATRKAIAELEAGKGKRFTSTDELMAELNADG
jgi:plasmid maintenance system antidote protein VapI